MVEHMLMNRLFIYSGGHYVATWLVAQNSLTSEDWVAVTLAYIGSEALVDIAARWKHGS